MSERFELMTRWLAGALPGTVGDIAPASADASFRRYFRVRHESTSLVVMDAPPDQEDCRPFVAIAEALAELGLQVPEILAADLKQGFLLLTDLGDNHYLDVLDKVSSEWLYRDALEALARLQLGGNLNTALLPAYDAPMLRRETDLFKKWYLDLHLGLRLYDNDQRILNDAITILCASALEQPRVWVHRDYHSRNLMVTRQRNPGVLDFQGAVIGPVTYDLVSLLKDCYIAWPRHRIEAWALGHHERLRSSGMPGLGSETEFLRWFDLMGAQRHLKAIGIFARLHRRDGKSDYLRDIPRTLNYVLDVCRRYPLLAELHDWLLRRVVDERP